MCKLPARLSVAKIRDYSLYLAKSSLSSIFNKVRAISATTLMRKGCSVSYLLDTLFLSPLPHSIVVAIRK